MAVTFALCEKEIYKRFNEFGIFFATNNNNNCYSSCANMQI